MGNKKHALNKQQQHPKAKANSDYNAFKVVLKYCLFIIFFPIVTFFTTKLYLFDEILKLEQIRSNIWAAVSSVIALHIALGLYIYKAYFEAEKAEEPVAKKQE